MTHGFVFFLVCLITGVGIDKYLITSSIWELALKLNKIIIVYDYISMSDLLVL